MNIIHISYSTVDNCYNRNSYGEICILCNCCGRFEDGIKKFKARREYHEEELNKSLNFNNFSENEKLKQIQLANRLSSVQYHIKSIRNYTRLIKRLTKIKKR